MISIIFVMLCCFAALLCCCFAALLLCCFTAVLLCGHRSKSFSVGVLWLTALVFTGLNFLKLWCGQGCGFLNWWSGGSSCVPWASKHSLIVILFAGHRTHSKISCWNHGFRFCNSKFSVPPGPCEDHARAWFWICVGPCGASDFKYVLWFSMLAIEHIPKFHVGIMVVFFLIRDFWFHLVYVKIMLELDSGLVLGPRLHRNQFLFRFLYVI